jgi:hypothetical protein
MALGDSPDRLRQRREAQQRYVAKRGKTPDKHKEYQRNYMRQKAGIDLSTIRYPQATHCEVCGDEIKDRNVQCDHDHSTGKFRGWLCGCCNRAIGQAKENPTRLRALASYIERTN